METTTLDTIARTVGASLTRRSALRGLFAGTVATVAGGALLMNEDASAKRRKRRRKKRRKGKGKNNGGNGGGTPTQSQGLPPGTSCHSSAQCTSHYICEVPVNGSNGDLYCSGGQDAICGAPNEDGDDTYPYCAVGYRCTFTGGHYTCQAIPDEL